MVRRRRRSPREPFHVCTLVNFKPFTHFFPHYSILTDTPKLAALFTTDTEVEDGARLRALVNMVHISELHANIKRKHIMRTNKSIYLTISVILIDICDHFAHQHLHRISEHLAVLPVVCLLILV